MMQYFILNAWARRYILAGSVKGGMLHFLPSAEVDNFLFLRERRSALCAVTAEWTSEG